MCRDVGEVIVRQIRSVHSIILGTMRMIPSCGWDASWASDQHLDDRSDTHNVATVANPVIQDFHFLAQDL